MNIFTIFFFYKIVAKYSPECIKSHHFKKISRGSIPPNPLAYKWLRHALHGTKRYVNSGLMLRLYCLCKHQLLVICVATTSNKCNRLNM